MAAEAVDQMGRRVLDAGQERASGGQPQAFDAQGVTRRIVLDDLVKEVDLVVDRHHVVVTPEAVDMVVERVLGAAQGFPPGIRQHCALGRHLVCRRVVLHDFPEVWWSAPPIATETVDLVGRAVLGAGQIAARLRQNFGHRSQCVG